MQKRKKTGKQLADRAYRELLRRITTGAFNPRERLTEFALCDLLGMSRTPVRQALHRLAAEGLLDASPHRGVRVRELTIPDMLGLALLREAIECQAARLAAARITARELRELYRRCDEMDSMSTQDPATAIYRMRAADAAFHNRLIELSGVRALADFYRRHHILQIHMFAPNITRIAENVPLFAGRQGLQGSAHRKIVNALATHDPQKAEDAVRASFQESIAVTRQGLATLNRGNAKL